MENDHNECPTCKQDWIADTDYECTACGRPASEHISVTSVCRILYETRAREASLIVERDELKDQLDAAMMLIRIHQRRETWPNDPDQFTSPDHDNDSRNYR